MREKNVKKKKRGRSLDVSKCIWFYIVVNNSRLSVVGIKDHLSPRLLFVTIVCALNRQI